MPTKLWAQNMNTSNSHDLVKHRPNSCELRDNYKGIKYTITDFILARAEASIELSLWSKLRGPLRRSSVQALLNSGTSELRPSLLSSCHYLASSEN